LNGEIVLRLSRHRNPEVNIGDRLAYLMPSAKYSLNLRLSERGLLLMDHRYLKSELLSVTVSLYHIMHVSRRLPFISLQKLEGMVRTRRSSA
jgi:hypothetical protein